MNQKTLVALSVAAIILGLVNATFLLCLNVQCNLPTQISQPDENSRRQLDCSLAAIRCTTEGEYVIQTTTKLAPLINFPNPTLYDCYIHVEHLTKSGAWSGREVHIGIINYKDTLTQEISIGNNFESDDTYDRNSLFTIITMETTSKSKPTVT